MSISTRNGTATTIGKTSTQIIANFLKTTTTLTRTKPKTTTTPPQPLPSTTSKKKIALRKQLRQYQEQRK